MKQWYALYVLLCSYESHYGLHSEIFAKLYGFLYPILTGFPIKPEKETFVLDIPVEYSDTDILRFTIVTIKLAKQSRKLY